MATVKTNGVKARLTLLQNEFTRKVQALADEVRTELVIPLCTKYKLEFISGMGVFFFSKKIRGEDVYIHDPEEANRLGYDGFDEVFDVLNIEVSSNDYIGFYVCDVKRSK